MVDADAARVIRLIVRAFEQGSVLPGYSEAGVLPDGAGITYGDHQATDASGSLDAILKRYVDLGGAAGDVVSRLIVPLLEADATVPLDPDALPPWCVSLLDVLRKLGDDSTMQRAQDEVFSERYWAPASEHFRQLALRTPLSAAILYDTCIHSGPAGVSRIRRLFPELPPSRGGDEKAWAEAYVRARRAWLAEHSRPIVRRTVYRMDSLLELIRQDNWNLNTPFPLYRPRLTIA